MSPLTKNKFMNEALRKQVAIWFTKIAAFGLAYLVLFLLPCYYAITHNLISPQKGVGLCMITTVVILFFTVVYAFNPFRKPN